mgnify:CR=1 FL=1
MRQNSEKGFALVLSLVLLLVMSLMGGALIVVASGDHKNNNTSDEYQQTFYVAETALIEGEKYIVDKEEHKTAPLHKRLLAIKKAQEAGYLIGLHIDPMIAYPEWEAGYGELVDAIFKHVSPNQVAWISMGSLRFNPEQKRLMHINFPGSKIASNEMVLGSDRKLRYVKPFRLMMYKYLYQKLCEKGAKEACVYLCMERFNVWESVFGFVCGCTGCYPQPPLL